MAKTTVVIPNWNGMAYLKNCMDSLEKQDDRDFETLAAFAKDNSLPGIQLFDPAGKKESAVGAAYKVKWIPSLYLIDKEGRIELGTVIAAKIAAKLSGKPHKIPTNNLMNVCEDGSCELE